MRTKSLKMGGKFVSIRFQTTVVGIFNKIYAVKEKRKYSSIRFGSTAATENIHCFMNIVVDGRCESV